jgi:Cu-Zn family superoxide dismutase
MGAHLGDLPNVTIGSNGSGSVTTSLGSDSATIDAALHDADGTAIVLHAAADDYRTDPTGNSGARIACGVLTRVTR